MVISKPQACRNSSIEGFVVCRNFNPPTQFIPSLSSHMKLLGPTSTKPCPKKPTSAPTSLTYLDKLMSDLENDQPTSKSGASRTCVPFVACSKGKWGKWDSDRTYPLSNAVENRNGTKEVEHGSNACNNTLSKTELRYSSLPSQVFAYFGVCCQTPLNMFLF